MTEDDIVPIRESPAEPLTRQMIDRISPIQRVFVSGDRLVFCGPRPLGMVGIPAISVNPATEPFEAMVLLMHTLPNHHPARLTEDKIMTLKLGLDDVPRAEDDDAAAYASALNFLEAIEPAFASIVIDYQLPPDK